VVKRSLRPAHVFSLSTSTAPSSRPKLRRAARHCERKELHRDDGDQSVRDAPMYLKERKPSRILCYQTTTLRRELQRYIRHSLATEHHETNTNLHHIRYGTHSTSMLGLCELGMGYTWFLRRTGSPCVLARSGLPDFPCAMGRRRTSPISCGFPACSWEVSSVQDPGLVIPPAYFRRSQRIHKQCVLGTGA
jgi:hypothetical protein